MSAIRSLNLLWPAAGWLCLLFVTAVAAELPWERLTTDGLLKQRPAFAPDGSVVVFSRHVGDKIQLIELNLQSREERRVTDRKDPEYDAVFAPDGKSLLFAFDQTSPNQGNIEVYQLQLADGALTRIAGDVGGLSHEESPSWSPDGERLAFTSTRDGNQELYVANRDGSEVQRLTSDPAIDAHPAWSPDGAWIAFSTNRWGDLEIALIRPNGEQLTRLTESPGLDDYPCWSPDGQWLAFTSNRDGQLEIYRMRPDGSEQTNLTRSPAAENFPAYTPAGRLAFVSDQDGGFDLYLLRE